MKCLAVNTATKILSIAIVDDGKTLHLFETPEMRDQGNVLLTHIREGLAKNGLDFPGLDLLAVVTGPGSFTGIRVGLSAMRGIALAAGKPLIGISSFDMFAAPEAGALNIVAVESWREELYFSLRPLMEDMNESPEVLLKRLQHHLTPGQKIILSGDAKKTAAAFFPQATLTERDNNAEDVARLALQRFREGGEGVPPLPYYLREADVTISTKTAHTLKARED
jgi:tRNA threonylcarbamoyladenosine biosynthesis protein TsaB